MDVFRQSFLSNYLIYDYEILCTLSQIDQGECWWLPFNSRTSKQMYKNKSFIQIKILHDISLLSNVNQCLCTYVGDHNVLPQSTLYKCLCTYVVDHNVSPQSTLYKCLCTYVGDHNVSQKSSLYKCLCTYVVDHYISLKVQEHYKHLGPW